jgi:hypothetical protein
MYLEQFQNVVDVIKHSGGSVGEMAGIKNNVMIKKGETTVSPEIKKEAQEQYLAVAFMLGSDRSRYGRLLESLAGERTSVGPKQLSNYRHISLQLAHELEARPPTCHAHRRTSQ